MEAQGNCAAMDDSLAFALDNPFEIREGPSTNAVRQGAEDCLDVSTEVQALNEVKLARVKT